MASLVKQGNLRSPVTGAEWSSTRAYLTGEAVYVTALGASYSALAPSTNVYPDGNAATWVLVAKGQIGRTGPKGLQFRQLYSSTTAYMLDDVVTDTDGNLYFFLTSSVSGISGVPLTTTASWFKVPTKGLKGDTGPGRSITGITIDAQNRLTIAYSDATSQVTDPITVSGGGSSGTDISQANLAQLKDVTDNAATSGTFLKYATAQLATVYIPISSYAVAAGQAAYGNFTVTIEETQLVSDGNGGTTVTTPATRTATWNYPSSTPFTQASYETAWRTVLGLHGSFYWIRWSPEAGPYGGIKITAIQAATVQPGDAAGKVYRYESLKITGQPIFSAIGTGAITSTKALGAWLPAGAPAAFDEANFNVAIGATPPVLPDATNTVVGAVCVGFGASVTAASGTAIGRNAAVTALQGTACGYSTTAAQNAVALGAQASAPVTSAIAIGNAASASGASGSLAVGYSASATGTYAIALGGTAIFSAAASAQNAIAVGYNAKAGAVGAHALGASTSAQSVNAVALGTSSSVTAAATNSVALGGSATASATSGTAVGNTAKATANQGVAVGYNTTASHDSSVVLGANSVSSTPSQVVYPGAQGVTFPYGVSLAARAIAAGTTTYLLTDGTMVAPFAPASATSTAFWKVELVIESDTAMLCVLRLSFAVRGTSVTAVNTDVVIDSSMNSLAYGVNSVAIVSGKVNITMNKPSAGNVWTAARASVIEARLA